MDNEKIVNFGKEIIIKGVKNSLEPSMSLDEENGSKKRSEIIDFQKAKIGIEAKKQK